MPWWYPGSLLRTVCGRIGLLAFRWPLICFIVPVLAVAIVVAVMVLTSPPMHLQEQETVHGFLAHFTDPQTEAVRDLKEYGRLFGENKRLNVALVRSLDDQNWNLLGNETMQIERMRAFHEDVMNIRVTLPVDPFLDLLPHWQNQKFNRSRAVLPKWNEETERVEATFRFEDLCAAQNDGSCFSYVFNAFWHDRDFGGRFGPGCSAEAVKFQYHDQFPERNFGPKAWPNVEIILRNPVLWDRPGDLCSPPSKAVQGTDGLTFMYVLDDRQTRRVLTHAWEEMEANVTDGRAPLGLIWRQGVVEEACAKWETAFAEAAETLKENSSSVSPRIQVDSLSFVSIQRETDIRRISGGRLLWSLRLAAGAMIALLLLGLHVSWSAVLQGRWRDAYATSKLRSAGMSALSVVLAWATAGFFLIPLDDVLTVEAMPVVVVCVGLSLVFDLFSSYFATQHIAAAGQAQSGRVESPAAPRSESAGGDEEEREQDGEREKEQKGGKECQPVSKPPGCVGRLCRLPQSPSVCSSVAEARTRRAVADSGVTAVVTLLSLGTLFLMGGLGAPYSSIRILCCHVLVGLALVGVMFVSFVPACLGLESRFEASKGPSSFASSASGKTGGGGVQSSQTVEVGRIRKGGVGDQQGDVEGEDFKNGTITEKRLSDRPDSLHPLERREKDIRQQSATAVLNFGASSSSSAKSPIISHPEINGLLSDLSTGEAGGLSLQAEMLRHPERWTGFSSQGFLWRKREVPNPLAELAEENEGRERPLLTYAATPASTLRSNTQEEGLNDETQGGGGKAEGEGGMRNGGKGAQKSSEKGGESPHMQHGGGHLPEGTAASSSSSSSTAAAAGAVSSTEGAAAGLTILRLPRTCSDLEGVSSPTPAAGPVSFRADSAITLSTPTAHDREMRTGTSVSPSLLKLCTDAEGTPQQGLRVFWFRSCVSRGLFHPVGLTVSFLLFAALVSFSCVGIALKSRFWLRSIADIADQESPLRSFFLNKETHFTEADDVLTLYAPEGLAWEDPAVQQQQNETFQRLNSSKDISLVESGFYRFLVFQQAQAPILKRMQEEEEGEQGSNGEDGGLSPTPFDSLGPDLDLGGGGGSLPSSSGSSASSSGGTDDFWGSIGEGDFFGGGGTLADGGAGSGSSPSEGFDWDWNFGEETENEEEAEPNSSSSSSTPDPSDALSPPTDAPTPDLSPSPSPPPPEDSRQGERTSVGSDPPSPPNTPTPTPVAGRSTVPSTTEGPQLTSRSQASTRLRKRSLTDSARLHLGRTREKQTEKRGGRLCGQDCWREWEDGEFRRLATVTAGVESLSASPVSLSADSMSPEREEFEKRLREWLRGDNITFWATSLLAQTHLVYAGPLFINDFVWEDPDNMRGLKTFRSIVVTRSPGSGVVDFRRYFEGNNVTGRLAACIYDPGASKYGVPAERSHETGCVGLHEIVVSISAFLRPSASPSVSSRSGSVFERGEEADAVIRNTTLASTTLDWNGKECLSWDQMKERQRGEEVYRGSEGRPLNNSMVIERRVEEGAGEGGEEGGGPNRTAKAAEPGVIILSFSADDETVPVRVYSLTAVCSREATVWVRGVDRKGKEWVEKSDCRDGRFERARFELSEQKKENSGFWPSVSDSPFPFSDVVRLEVASDAPFALADVALWPEPAPALRGGDLGTRFEQLDKRVVPALGGRDNLRLTSTFWLLYQSLPNMLAWLKIQLIVFACVYFILVCLFVDPILALFAWLFSCSACVCVLGLMAYWDVGVHEVSLLWAIISPALAVTAVTKMVGAYAQAGGETRKQRAAVSLILAGPPILFFVSTLLIIAFFLSPLYTGSVLLNVGAQILFLTAVSSGFHSLVALPCALCLFGPFSHKRRASQRAFIKARLRSCVDHQEGVSASNNRKALGRKGKETGDEGKSGNEEFGLPGVVPMATASMCNAAMHECPDSDGHSADPKHSPNQ
uniref:SSD domain-containing protein n=1 Tax=Chromera velia CCMP2878 TaxID=1169474 RepID=A0A0G4I8P8_9ALVE|eukprot:Cvel_12023.t1-p1 / transcript=Cvel_12023.t1 / gene=Cvel_12023 / organism=Chromera_velia_CCMP2878 / gene_product=hypothetical protein / transcript_product=hypothetical protein / location=Cvel_scaffold772:8496-16572(-) / protein_length=1942 / sequence_SO=supercontig / SO=protein_coding / is_pseudo=false